MSIEWCISSKEMLPQCARCFRCGLRSAPRCHVQPMQCRFRSSSAPNIVQLRHGPRCVPAQRLVAMHQQRRMQRGQRTQWWISFWWFCCLFVCSKEIFGLIDWNEEPKATDDLIWNCGCFIYSIESSGHGYRIWFFLSGTNITTTKSVRKFDSNSGESHTI